MNHPHRSPKGRKDVERTTLTPAQFERALQKLTREQFEDRRRWDADFCDAYDDYAHYCRVITVLARTKGPKETR